MTYTIMQRANFVCDCGRTADAMVADNELTDGAFSLGAFASGSESRRGTKNFVWALRNSSQAAVHSQAEESTPAMGGEPFDISTALSKKVPPLATV